LLIIDAETGLPSHPSTLECVSPNSGILFPNFLGASSERITLYFLHIPAVFGQQHNIISIGQDSHETHKYTLWTKGSALNVTHAVYKLILRLGSLIPS
jgi:hypothetical protein